MDLKVLAVQRRLTPLRFGLAPCGCLHEYRCRQRVVEAWRCEFHVELYRRIESVWSLRRCESCLRRAARYRIVFGDGATWLLCFGCEPARLP